MKIEKIKNMKVGDRVRIKIGGKYTKETYEVAKILTGELIVDVTHNSYGIGWAGYTEDKIKLKAQHLYWYVNDYIKVKLEKLVI